VRQDDAGSACVWCHGLFAGEKLGVLLPSSSWHRFFKGSGFRVQHADGGVRLAGSGEPRIL